MMRKVLCFFIALLTLTLTASTCLAAEEEQDLFSRETAQAELKQEEITLFTSKVIPVTNGKNFRGGTLREFRFDRCMGKEACSDKQAYTLDQDGDVSLYLEVLSWSPADGDVGVGLYNTETKALTYRTVSGGTVKDELLTFEDVPAGDYWLVVWNLSENALAEGSVRYSFS